MTSHNTIFRVITYHRIAPLTAALTLDPALISATPESFARQMQYLEQRYNIISIDELLNALANGQSLPPRAVLISFDDGHHDLYEYAWPVLKQLRIPAVIFVATDYASQPETPFWWDKIANAIYHTDKQALNIAPFAMSLPNNINDRRMAVKAVKSELKRMDNTEKQVHIEAICQYLGEKQHRQIVSLDWEKLRHLHQHGIAIGAHSQSHPLLTQMPLEQAESEIVGSQQVLQRELGDSYPIFCYPNGNYNEGIITILKNHGFSLAFSTEDGHNDLRYTNAYCLHRTNITPRTSMSIFRFRLTRLGALVDRWRHGK